MSSTFKMFTSFNAAVLLRASFLPFTGGKKKKRKKLKKAFNFMRNKENAN